MNAACSTLSVQGSLSLSVVSKTVKTPSKMELLAKSKRPLIELRSLIYSHSAAVEPIDVDLHLTRHANVVEVGKATLNLKDVSPGAHTLSP